MRLNKVRIILLIFSTLVITTSNAFAQTLPTQDPELDKRLFLSRGNPTIFVGTQCVQPSFGITANAQVGGVLWPTLVQVKNFLAGYVGGQLCVTGGSEAGHRDFGHPNGFKVDLRISKTNTFDDPLSTFVISPLRTHPFFNTNNSTLCRSDGAPQYQDFSSVLYAMEYPMPPFGSSGYKGPASCVPVPSSINVAAACCHWDILSSFASIDLSSPSFDTVSQSIRFKLGESASIVPLARDSNGNKIDSLFSWMFDYNIVAHPDPGIALVDPTGIVVGTKVGSVPVMVSEGTVFSTINVTIDMPDPPDSRTCDVTGPPCWMWDPSGGNGDGAWIWNPGQPTSNPNPPGPAPAPGQCAGNSAQNVPPTGCWVWDPTANNGAGAWIFIRPQGGGTTTSWPVTPVSSVDPNDIFGLPGVGSARYLTNISQFTYLIQFENQATATAPAQQVTVTDALNAANFDLSTVTLGPINFPGQVVTPPAVPLVALGAFSTDVDLRPTTNLIVRVMASLNPQTGLLSWSMTSLDPATLQPPSDPLAGFLPPGSDGSVSLVVNARGSLASGTTVSDQASIVFDTNPAIATPVWSNTIDSTPPASSVAALPATESSANFTVAWQGTDSGAGIQDFTIFVSDDGGPFSIWVHNTTATSATFFGQWGHTYAFYSIARDLVGNIESTKTTAETTTQVIPDPIPPTTTATLSPQPNGAGWNNSDVTVDLTSFDNPGGPGVKQIQWSLAGALAGSSTVPGSATAVTISAEGTTTLTYYATDNGGKQEIPHSLTVQIDKTPPVIAASANPSALWPANGKMVNVTVSGRITDPTSGVNPSSAQFAVVDKYGSVHPSGNVTLAANGAYSFMISLQASRLGTAQNGRTYTITVTAQDNAGNQSSASTAVVVPHDQGH